MNEQTDLFTPSRYPEVPGYARNSRTSFAAAVSVMDSAKLKRACVLQFIRSRVNGATGDEIAAALHMQPNAVAPRLLELREVDKAIVDSGLTRATRAGRQAVVYVEVKR